jgi:1-hydroxycarotenoid 3,4-desaturase
VPLARHNVFFSSDYAAEFADIRSGAPPFGPTVYVCAQDRDDGGQDPAGAERLLMIVNAPANGDGRAMDQTELSECEDRVFTHLARCGLELARQPELCRMTTPTMFAGRFPGTGGALYGTATHGWDAAFRRAGARSRIPGLYLAGGSVHPGPGVPMAALSGRLAARRFLADRGSTASSRPVAMSGGTSTR